MLNLAHSQQIFVYTEPTDMRKSFAGLAGLVNAHFAQKLTDGALFVFFNRRLDSVKILAWDRDGLAIWYKRLESGTFQLAALGSSSSTLQIDPIKLQLLLSGIDLSSVKERKRYRVA